MKALTFPELYGLTATQKVAYYKAVNHIPDNRVLSLTSEQISNWYYAKTQQSFKPEVAVELFEITNHQVTDRLTYYHERFEVNDVPIDITSYSICYGDYTFELYPRTLDEFNTDCQRARIELKWRIK